MSRSCEAHAEKEVTCSDRKQVTDLKVEPAARVFNAFVVPGVLVMRTMQRDELQVNEME
jgi:hypothetical protein